ncbi:MAG: hypothetical protein FD127_1732 [Acidimicrobiaceae bacterium]|nr:MAG: hypothetical protein FD127_1732 [Acidimicrobiaceae bacterium]
MRRSDDQELCGHIVHVDGGWHALTVFGAVLGTHDHRDPAVRQVLDVGLAFLADRWTLRHRCSGGEDDDEIVCIIEATPTSVTVARGVYALPDTPKLTITRDQIVSGEWTLRH